MFCRCAVYKNKENSKFRTEENNLTAESIEKIKKNNITENSFFIEKGKISISKSEEVKNFYFSVKFIKPDDYLISIRAVAGIEIARIFLSRDTILVNDRISRKTLYGKASVVEEIVRFPLELIKVGMGDIVLIKGIDKNSKKCFNGRMIFEGYFKGQKIIYVVDCNKQKLISASISNSILNEDVNLYFNKYKRIGSIKVPKKIEINDSIRNVKIFIRIEKIKIPWNGEIEFVPGRGYEVKKLK
jgi:hypothetical protein